MLKNILNINGIQKLNKKDQKTVLGGIGPGLCYMPNRTTCCCYFEDRRDFICASGRPTGPTPGSGCVFGG